MNPISINYTDQELRILVEEFITMQKADFPFKGVCFYILYRATEEERTASNGLFESNQMAQTDCARVGDVLKKFIAEGRIITNKGNVSPFGDDATFTKTKE